MKIIYKKSFQSRLSDYIDFIASDNINAAKKIKYQLLAKIQSIPENPYIHRQSVYFNDPFIRDCIFKGCTIVFKIEPEQIIIFGFLKQQQSPTDDEKSI